MDPNSLDISQIGSIDSFAGFRDWAYVQLVHNQFLIAGLVTLVSGGLMYILRSTPGQIWHWLQRTFSTVLVVQSTHDNFAEIGHFINKLRINFLQRDYLLHHDLTLGPGYGTSIMWYKGRPLFVTREKQDSQAYEFKELLTLRFFSRDHKKLEEFLKDVHTISKGEFKVSIFTRTGGHWDYITKRAPRSLTNIFIPERDKKMLVDRIKVFLQSEDWYKRTGVPYKLAILLHGIPGVGKSSLIHALASEFEFSIKLVNLNTASEGSFFTVFSRCDKSLVVIEDIDTFKTAQSRKKKKNPIDEPENELDQFLAPMPINPLSLSTLLNAIDGLPTSDSLILVATTNHLDRLDPALIRKGRFDIIMEVKPLDHECIHNMFVAFYGKEKEDLILDLINSGDYVEITGADAQDIFMHNDADHAVRLLKAKKSSHHVSVKENILVN